MINILLPSEHPYCLLAFIMDYADHAFGLHMDDLVDADPFLSYYKAFHVPLLLEAYHDPSFLHDQADAFLDLYDQALVDASLCLLYHKIHPDFSLAFLYRLVVPFLVLDHPLVTRY